MEKIKAFFKWIFANKKSLGSTIIGAVGAGAGITASWSLESLPQIMVGSFNAAPIIYTAICVVCFILNELGVCGKGFEAVKTFIERKQVESEAAKEKALEKAAEKQIKADEKVEISIAKEAEKQIKADEKAKEEAEYAAKVEAKKAELLAKKEN